MFDLVPVRRKNQDALRQMLDSFHDLFHDEVSAPFRGETHKLRADIREHTDGYSIETELPGFSKADIQVTYTKPYLHIRAVRNQQSEQDEQGKVIRRERSYGVFVRRFYIEDIDQAAIKATFKDGLLTLDLPKLSKPERQTQQIAIE